MTPLAALVELLARVGAGQGSAVLITAKELAEWPLAAVTAMQSQRLLVKARPAGSVVCPGCERECVMPVRTLSATPRRPASFVVCDKRSDINRVSVAVEQLTQWRCDLGVVGEFVATALGVRRRPRRVDDADLLEIGIVSGRKRQQMICLQVDDDLSLVAGSNAVPLAELVDYRDGVYALDHVLVRQLVDAATTADPRYTPNRARLEARKLDIQDMRRHWQRAYHDLRQQHPDMSDVWYARKIARQDIANGRSTETIRKSMKK